MPNISPRPTTIFAPHYNEDVETHFFQPVRRFPRSTLLRLGIFSFIAVLSWGQPSIFPLSEVRAGQTGVGRTVFQGLDVDEFQVEILGILENVAPKQSIILARLSGGPLAETGVMQGMSGSPVYIDGRLVGAVALGFENSKAAIAGIRPIEEMLRVDPEPANPLAAAASRGSYSIPGGIGNDTRLVEIATPVSFSGFSAATLERFAPQLRALGLDPRQGVSGGGQPGEEYGDPATLEPGSMISVQMLSGDMNVGADGTLTLMDGDQVYAFGHSLLSGGTTQMPFARSEVIALLPSTTNSFKISKANQWMGVITEDRNVAISGITGRRADLAPMNISVGENTYRMNVVNDPVMTPLLAQMAISSALDVTERSVGPVTLNVRGRINFAGGSVAIDNAYTGDVAVSSLAANAVASPLSYALSSGFDDLSLTGIDLEIEIEEQRSQRRVSGISGPRIARPGEEIELTVLFSGANGEDAAQTVRYQVPVGAPEGYLNFTIADAATMNSIEFQGVTNTPFRSSEQVLNLLNGLRPNTNAYLRVWRDVRSFKREGQNLPAPPASLALILNRVEPVDTSTAAGWGSKIGEIVLPGNGNVVTGSDTLRVEVKP